METVYELTADQVDMLRRCNFWMNVAQRTGRKLAAEWTPSYGFYGVIHFFKHVGIIVHDPSSFNQQAVIPGLKRVLLRSDYRVMIFFEDGTSEERR